MNAGGTQFTLSQNSAAYRYGGFFNGSYPSLKIPSQTCTEAYNLGDSEVYQVDRINHHNYYQYIWRDEERRDVVEKGRGRQVKKKKKEENKAQDWKHYEEKS